MSIKKFLLIAIGAGIIIGLIGRMSGSSRPSVCDCRKVMLYEEGSVEAAKSILGGAYGDKFMERSQRECGLKYWEDIKKWQEGKGLAGTPVDNAMEYFIEKCK